MARLVPAVLMLALSPIASPAAAQDASWRAPKEARPAPNFDIPEEHRHTDQATGARFLVGREVMPNTTIGLGIFGQKDVGNSLEPVTAKNLSTPKQRRAAVGFSLRF